MAWMMRQEFLSGYQVQNEVLTWMSVGKEIGCTWNFSHHLLVGHLFIADEKSLPEFVTSKEFFYRKVRF
jgi:hypothetical protein